MSANVSCHFCKLISYLVELGLDLLKTSTTCMSKVGKSLKVINYASLKRLEKVYGLYKICLLHFFALNHSFI